MKTFQTFVGIDISKLSLDVCVIDASEPDKASHYKVSNDSKGLIGLIREMKQKGIAFEDTLFVCENTGIYTTPFVSSPISVRIKSRFFF